MSEFTDIPVLDVSAVHGEDSGAKQALAREFAEVYGRTGFGYITGHGVPQALVDRVFAASARFHDLPRDAKMTLALDRNHRDLQVDPILLKCDRFLTSLNKHATLVTVIP